MVKYLFALLGLILPGFLPAQIVINEFMSSNDETIEDEDGESSDWIELYNNGATTINLLGYYLSDDESNIQKWALPAIEISPQQHLLVFCSGKNRQLPEFPLHTNFKLNAQGEIILLSQHQDIRQSIQPVTLSTDHSLAAIPDGSTNFLISSSPTPNTENEIPLSVNFSHNPGFYEQPIQLSLTQNIPLENAVIRYTSDGSIPVHSSPLFDQDIPIINRSGQDNDLSTIPTTPDYTDWTGEPTYPDWYAPEEKVAKGTVINAAVFLEGVRISEVITNTYFIFPEGKNRYTLPVVSLTCPKDSLFDNERGIYVPGDALEEDDIVWSGNYFNSGTDWEREANLEYFVDGQNVLNQNVGIRIHGGKTRGAAQKTLKVFARSAYGKKRMSYPFFKNKDQDSYKRILLRSTMSAWDENILTDAYAHQTAKGLNFDIQESQPVIVFINGEYWGIHDMRERADQFKLADDYDLDEDSIQIYGSWGGIIDGAPDLSFYEFRDGYLANNDITHPDVYQYVSSRIDIDNFIDYYFTEIYLNNVDWPANNLRMWRSEQYDDKWRWIFYDLDGGFGASRLENKIIPKLLDDSAPYYNQAEWATILIRTLIKNETFQQKFIDRSIFLLKNHFKPYRMLMILNEMTDQYSPEMVEHFERWLHWSSYSHWQNQIHKHLKEFVLRRPCILEEQMVDYFGIAPFLDCDTTIPSSVTIFPNPTSGVFSIKFDPFVQQVFQCELFNSLGQCVLRYDLLPANNDEINISHLPSGIYYLRISSYGEEQIFTKKVLKR